MAKATLYKRVLLKLSGEALMGDGDYGIEPQMMQRVAKEIAEVVDMGVQLVGGQALVKGHPLERLYRQVRSLRLIEGANDLLRINLVKGNLELKKGRI